MVQAFILSRYDYSNSLYLGTSKAMIRKLQVAQNCAARLLLNIPRNQSAQQALNSLHWLPVAERIKFKSLYCPQGTVGAMDR